MNERWKIIQGFDDYLVSDQGWIRRGNNPIAPSQTRDGTLKVNLSQRGAVVTRSVKTLVAQAFVPNEQPDIPPEVDIYGDVLRMPVTSPWDTPILKDGDQRNCHYLNIAWRPRWFAWKYTRQFNLPPPRVYEIEVLDTDDGVVYASVMDAGIAHGILWQDIYNSILTGNMVFPTGHVYDVGR